MLVRTDRNNSYNFSNNIFGHITFDLDKLLKQIFNISSPVLTLGGVYIKNCLCLYIARTIEGNYPKFYLQPMNCLPTSRMTL